MRFVGGAAGLLLGIAIGLLAGWVVWPVEYSNVTPDVLADTYQFDNVMMVATTYATDGGLQLARGRFDRLGAAGPGVLLAVVAAERDDPVALAALEKVAADPGSASPPTSTTPPTN